MDFGEFADPYDLFSVTGLVAERFKEKLRQIDSEGEEDSEAEAEADAFSRQYAIPYQFWMHDLLMS